jgi:uncharacterized OB-fold protein
MDECNKNNKKFYEVSQCRFVRSWHSERYDPKLKRKIATVFCIKCGTIYFDENNEILKI